MEPIATNRPVRYTLGTLLIVGMLAGAAPPAAADRPCPIDDHGSGELEPLVPDPCHPGDAGEGLPSPSSAAAWECDARPQDRFKCKGVGLERHGVCYVEWWDDDVGWSPHDDGASVIEHVCAG